MHQNRKGSTMKVATSLVLTAFCASAVSAFGLYSPASTVKSAAKNVGFAKKPMVQPVDINGNRMPMSLKESAAAGGDALDVSGGAAKSDSSSEGFAASLKSIDVPLMLYFLFWYVGNYMYNITNKLALKAAGGADGFPMAISSMQLFVGCLYGIFLWIAPDARSKPSVTLKDIQKMLPVAFCFMGAHSASVFAMGAGAVSFAQIVKASEPAFAAVLSQFVYKNEISKAKWMCLPIVIGGVILASVKELDFATSALISACIANLFAAVKGNENKKLMETDGLKERIGSVGNQFALTTILGFLLSVPLVIAKEGSKLPEFFELVKTNKAVWANVVASGLWFYGYNELATMTLKKTGAVTQSVANTAKRVIVIVGVALVLGESLDPIKLLGCAIGIGGVFLYSIIDNIVKPDDDKKKKTKKA